VKVKPIKEQIREAILSGTFSSVEAQLKENGIPLRNEQTGKMRDWADIVDDIAEKWDKIK
jgi:hypothetical protein